MLGGDRRIVATPIQIDPDCRVGWMSDPDPLNSDQAVQAMMQAAASLGATYDELRRMFTHLAQSVRQALTEIDPFIKSLAAMIDQEESYRHEFVKLVPNRRAVDRQHKAITKMGMQRAAIQRKTYMPGKRWRG